jgi:uncharacterized protein (UPF0335 family)
MSDGNIAADQLRLYIERIERLEEEKKGLQDDTKDVYLEAKSQGYDPKTMRTIVRLRKMEKGARDEAESLLETYKTALGMDSEPSRPRISRAPDRRPDPAPPASPPSADLHDLYVTAVGVVTGQGSTSTSFLQRQLRIGYNSAARLVEQMERDGIVGAPDHVGRRELLLDAAGAAQAIVDADLRKLSGAVKPGDPAEPVSAQGLN